MTQYSELKSALQPHLDWHGARLSFLALFLLALLKVKTVNLTQLAIGAEGKSKSVFKYKHLQRFFRYFDLDYFTIAKLVISWREIPQPWVLSIDRTTWEFGSHCYNILTIGSTKGSPFQCYGEPDSLGVGLSETNGSQSLMPQ